MARLHHYGGLAWGFLAGTLYVEVRHRADKQNKKKEEIMQQIDY